MYFDKETIVQVIVQVIEQNEHDDRGTTVAVWAEDGNEEDEKDVIMNTTTMMETPLYGIDKLLL